MSPLFGTCALLRTRLRPARNFLVATCIVGLLSGLAYNLNGSHNGLEGFLAVLAGLAALIAPLVTATGITIPSQNPANFNAGFQRRDELLTLPVGRLALPSAVFLGSALLFLLAAAGLVVSMSLVMGPLPLIHGVRFLGEDPQWCYPGIAFAWLGFTSLAAIGAHRASLAVLWPGLPVLVFLALPRMGYSDAEASMFLGASGLCLGLYYLVLPFLLYARPRHLWANSRSWGRERLDGLGLVMALLAPLCFLILGLGSLLLALLALGAGKAWREARRYPAFPRASWSHLRLTTLGGLLALAPVCVTFTAVDFLRVRSAADLRTGEVVTAVLSPDGRHLVLEVLAPAGASAEERIRRVQLVDLQGEQPPRVFSPRFATLAANGDGTCPPCCWSRDGRYLALYDLSLGRTKTFLFDDVLASVSAEVGPAWQRVVASLFTRATDTWIVDTQTGEVQVRSALLVRPGWQRPEELLSLRVDLRGDFVLEDGAGHEATLSAAEGPVQVAAYLDGAALIQRSLYDSPQDGEAWLQLGAGLSKPPLLRWTPEGPEPWSPDDVQSDWLYQVSFHEELATDAAAPGDVLLVPSGGLLRQGRRQDLPQGVAPLGWYPERGVVLSGREGLSWLDLQDGSRRTLTAEEPDRLVQVAGGVFLQTGGLAVGPWRYADDDSGRLRALPRWVSPEAQPVGWTADGELLAWRGGHLVLGGDDSEPRLLSDR